MARLLFEKQWKSVLIISHSPRWCRRDPALNNTRWFTHDTWQWIHETGSSLLVTYAWSLREEDTTQGHMGLHSGAGANQPELWATGFVVTGKWHGPRSHRRVWFAGVTNRVGWQGPETYWVRDRVGMARLAEGARMSAENKELMVRTPGLHEGHRWQSSTWNVRPYSLRGILVTVFLLRFFSIQSAGAAHSHFNDKQYWNWKYPASLVKQVDKFSLF